jgi:YD repeat-containing protein
LSKPSEIDLQPEVSTAGGSNPGVDNLREEGYKEMFNYCRTKDGPNSTGFCTTPEGDFVIEFPFLGRIVVQNDKTIVHIQPDGTYLKRDKDQRVTYLQQPNGKIRTFEYDSNGKVSSWTNPDGTVSQRVQDVDGHQQWMIKKNGRWSTTAIKSAEVNQAGELQISDGRSTYTYKTNGHIVGTGGNETREADDQGRLVKDERAQGTTKYRYGTEGCIDEVTTMRHFIAIKEADGWGNYSPSGNRHASTYPDPSYEKYGSMREGCSFKDGKGIDVDDTNEGKTVKIRDQDGTTTTLNFDRSGELIKSQTFSSMTYRREGLVWKSYDADGHGPIETLSYRDMSFAGLDDANKQLQCLSEAAKRAQ